MNSALSAAKLDLPADYDMGPMREYLPGYPGPEKNGGEFRVCWGHLLKCQRVNGRLMVVSIVGWEGEQASDPKSTD